MKNQMAQLPLFLFVLIGGVFPSVALAHYVNEDDCPSNLDLPDCYVWIGDHNYGGLENSHMDHPEPTTHTTTFPTHINGCANLVDHAATPVRVFSCDEGILFYWVGQGKVESGPAFAPLASLALIRTTTLYAGINPCTGKLVSITYHPAGQFIRVSTYYADNAMDVDKPYVFDISSDGTVIHWIW